MMYPLQYKYRIKKGTGKFYNMTNLAKRKGNYEKENEAIE